MYRELNALQECTKNWPDRVIHWLWCNDEWLHPETSYLSIICLKQFTQKYIAQGYQTICEKIVCLCIARMNHTSEFFIVLWDWPWFEQLQMFQRDFQDEWICKSSNMSLNLHQFDRLKMFSRRLSWSSCAIATSRSPSSRRHWTGGRAPRLLQILYVVGQCSYYSTAGALVVYKQC